MRFRAPVAADAPAVLAVLVARDVADLGAPDYLLEDLLDEWRASDLELDRDARVVEDAGGQILAYGAVRRHGARVVVAPEHEGRGIGALLLEWAEARERERGRDTYRQWVAAANVGARELLTSAGYKTIRSYWRMVRALEGALSPPPPGDVRLRPLDAPRDAVALHALDAASFADALDYVPESLVEFREEHLGGHDFAADLSLVAERGEQVVGFLLARRWPEEQAGYVDLLAVAPDHQRGGIGTALLQGAFSVFAGAGLRQAQLSVASDNPRALHVYERVGMSVRWQFDIYERQLGGSAGQ